MKLSVLPLIVIGSIATHSTVIADGYQMHHTTRHTACCNHIQPVRLKQHKNSSDKRKQDTEKNDVNQH